jgi:hypothetical protein
MNDGAASSSRGFLLKMFSVLDASRGDVQVCLDTRISGALPLDLAYPECLNVPSLAALPYCQVGK